MSGLLQQMAQRSAQRVAAARRGESEAALLERARATPAAPPLRLHARFDVIAEIKRRAPSAGALADGAESLDGRVDRYAAGGAAAVSVLTEPERFDGCLADLAVVAARIAARGIPAMRKDFLVAPYQIIEARAAGAGGILLILRMLDAVQALEMADCAAELGLWVLAEAFDAQELAAAAELAARSRARVLVGLNCRDLTSLAVDKQRLTALADQLPGDLPCIAESGIETPADAAAVAADGYRAALIGSALMRRTDPDRLIRAMLRAARAEALHA